MNKIRTYTRETRQSVQEVIVVLQLLGKIRVRLSDIRLGLHRISAFLDIRYPAGYPVSFVGYPARNLF